MPRRVFGVSLEKHMNNGDCTAASVPLVMLVDDERGLLELFANMIARLLECEVIPVDDGATALATLEHITPDLLILDLGLPMISGNEVLRYVHNMPRLSQMKVVVLTARPHLISEIEPLGIDGWYTKPIHPQDFLDMVQKMLPPNRCN